MQNSGKLVIIGILAVGLLASGTSWWFRYAATHKAARYWGSKTARLIRDASIVELYEWRRLPDSVFQSDALAIDLETAGGRNISQARGLIHLRTAFLEDQSYIWPAEQALPGSWEWALVFREPQENQSAMIFITSDWKYVGHHEGGGILSCEPISEGLKNFISELPSRSAETKR
jgi:hypothetical protein